MRLPEPPRACGTLPPEGATRQPPCLAAACPARLPPQRSEEAERLAQVLPRRYTATL